MFKTFLPDHDYFQIHTLDLLSENVVTYIAGFIVKKMKKYVKCDKCLLALETVDNNIIYDDSSYMLLRRKNRGGLIRPSRHISKMLKYAEIKIRTFLNVTKNKLPNDRYFFDRFIYKCYIDLLQETDIFQNLDDHIFDISTFSENHKVMLIKMAINFYCKLRFHSIAKKQTDEERGVLIRKQYSKLILFQNQ